MEDSTAQPQEAADDSAKPDGLLYHYTDQKGLLGILESKQLWATHYRYLNDTSEGKIARELLFDELKRSSDESDEGVISQGERILSEITSQDVYVTSFSEKGNLLSQWRAYSGKSGGYSIGFSPNYLKTIGAHFIKNISGPHYTPDNPLIQCQYFNDDVEKQLKEKIQKEIGSYIAEAERIKRTLPFTEQIGRHTPAGIALRHFWDFSRDCAITKDHAFHEEREWRLVVHLRHNDVSFRQGRSMLIPYLKIPLTCPEQRLEIKRIFIGPCSNPAEAWKSVDMLLKRQNIYCVDVKDSMIPYRSL
jgi:hypothetical protein